MALQEIDFEGVDNKGENSTSTQKPDETTKSVVNQEDITTLGTADTEDITGNGEQHSDDNSTSNNDVNNDNSSTGELSVGDQLEIDGSTYTVDKDGNIVDEKGNIFKEAKDIKEWLNSVNVENEEDSKSITLSSIQEALGVTVTDEKGNTVDFADTPEGVKSYIDSVIELRSQELQEAAINRLYNDNPMLKQFQDYVKVMGTARGFGNLPDRSGIVLDKDNENQLVAVIKMAAQEFGNKSLNDNYIKYLRDSGGLYDEARNQLEALVDKDKNYRKEIEAKAEKQRQQEADNIKHYWENVNNVINSRIIGGYKIPETFTKEVNGKKIVLTPNDFFDYIASANVEDENGYKITGYQKDLANLTDEEYLNREMLDAWLMYTGGTYKDLIDMAVKEDAVRKLVVRSKQNRSTKSVKVVKKQTGKTSIDDIIF